MEGTEENIDQKVESLPKSQEPKKDKSIILENANKSGLSISPNLKRQPENPSANPNPQNQPQGTDRVLIENQEIEKEPILHNTEEILYESPVELPADSNFHLIKFIFISIGLDLLLKIVIGILIINAYRSAPLNLKPIVIAVIIYQIIRILVDVYFWGRYGGVVPQEVPIYITDILVCIGFIVVFSGAYAALNGNINPEYLYAFVIPHMILCFIRIFYTTQVQAPYLPGTIFAFIESIQILLIAIFLAPSQTNANWTWILLIYYFCAIAFLVLAGIVVLLVLIFGIVFLFNPAALENLPFLAVALILTIAFFLTWLGIVYFMLLTGFDILLTSGHISFAKNLTTVPDKRLLIGAWIMVICALITFILLLIIYWTLKDFLLKALAKGKAKEISLISFAKDLNLDITKVSDNYFKPTTDNNGKTLVNDTGENAVCLTCMDKPSCIMIKPCGHGGMCTDCIKEYVKDKDVCFMCREKMEEIFLLEQNEETKGFLAKGVIKIKR